MMLQLIEKEIMNVAEVMLALDHLVAKVDAYLSLAVAAGTFGLNVKPEVDGLGDLSPVKVEKARNLLTEF